MNKNTQIIKKITCTKCHGGGDLPPLRRYNHPSIGSCRTCWKCQGSGTIDCDTTLETTVYQGVERFIFKAIVHISNKADDLIMEQDDFYKNWRSDNSIPTFPHHEVELIGLDEKLLSSSRTIDNKPQELKLHIHPVGEKDFMCYTPDLSSVEDVIPIWEMWCLGSVWSWDQFNKGEEKYDFAYLLEDGIRGEKFDTAIHEADIYLYY